MRLKVEHRTHYRYATSVEIQAHQLIIFPRDSGELTTVRRSLECEPTANLTWSIDVFGNQVATAVFSEAATQLIIIAEAIVDHHAPDFPIFAIDPGAHRYPFTYSLDDLIDLGALAQPDWLKPGGDRVASWARAFVMTPSTDTLSLLNDLNAGILDHITYRVRDEAGTQSPEETLSLGSGSCRDIAALFIEAARHLGFGARAVSGYLYVPEQAIDDGGATHAWAEVFLPGAGWIAFDPTHRRIGSSHLIPTAYARHNRQIMPITGGYLGAATDFMSLDVMVRVTDLPVGASEH